MLARAHAARPARGTRGRDRGSLRASPAAPRLRRGRQPHPSGRARTAHRAGSSRRRWAPRLRRRARARSRRAPTRRSSVRVSRTRLPSSPRARVGRSRARRPSGPPRSGRAHATRHRTRTGRQGRGAPLRPRPARDSRSFADGSRVRTIARRRCVRERESWASHVQFAPMRTTWNGSVSFGLVNIPVGLAPATKPAARQSDVSFRMLHRECGTPIKQKRWCPVHERDVESDELVRGWEVAKGQFVLVEDADLEAIERHDTSRSIEISRFVRLEEVDPIYFDRTYFLVPAGAEAARRPYVLLLEAMKEAGVAALGRFVLAGKEKLCLIRPMGEALALETLFVHEDVKDHAEIDEAVATSEVKAPEL